jgi:indolepyruvate ferredoxin oxidoreductase, beta subunit
MKAKDINFLVVGVGGQGTILSGDILSEVGLEAGRDAKKSDVLGLAIRGGSVISHVRWAEKVGSPMCLRGTVDYLLAYEPLEALRVLEFLKPQGTVLVNEYRLPPMLVSTGQAVYPSKEEVDRGLKASAEQVFMVNATEKARQIGNVKAVNILLLGALSSLLEVQEETWQKVIRKYVPPKFLDLNLAAFAAGRGMLS